MKFKLLFIIIILSIISVPHSAFALSAQVHIPEKYTDVLAGERRVEDNENVKFYVKE